MYPVYRDRYLPAFTLDQIKALPGKEQSIVIVPTGAIEQHGPHLPVGVDAMMGQVWLNYTLPKLAKSAKVYVSPPITVGKSNEHTGFPGTLIISRKTLRRQLRAVAVQQKDFGFKTLAVLNTHGGNTAVIRYTLREIQDEMDMTTGMLGFEYDWGMSDQESTYGFHAGEAESSWMYAALPELCKPESADCEFPASIEDSGELRPENAPAIFSWVTQDLSKSGIMGDATQATAVKGKEMLEGASEALASKLESLCQWAEKRYAV